MAELFVTSNGETLDGTNENDILEAIGFSETILNGLEGDDELFAGTDGTLNGGIGNDILDATAGGGGNTLNGEGGDDTLFGRESDLLNGGEGADRLFTTGAGGNTYTGDAGADQFWLAQSEIPSTANTVTDFNQGEDVLGIGGLDGTVDSFADVTVTEADGNTTVAIEDGNTVLATLEGFTEGLTADDFAIVSSNEPTDDEAPLVEGATFEVEEESAVGTEVGTVTVADAQGDDFTLVLSGELDVDGDGEAAFEIDDTGLITVNDSDDLDFETQQSFDFEVTAEDTNGNIGTGNVTVDLINDPADDDEAPTVEGATFEVEEESTVGTEVGTVTVADAQGDDFTLALNGELDVDGDGEAAFEIDDTGLITVNDSDDLDFETQQSFDFEVTAEDTNGNIGTGNVTVDLINDPADDPEPGELQSDFNGDGLVNLNDLGVFAAAFGTSDGDESFNGSADLTGDGLVNLNDLGVFASEFGTSA